MNKMLNIFKALSKIYNILINRSYLQISFLFSIGLLKNINLKVFYLGCIIQLDFYIR